MKHITRKAYGQTQQAIRAALRDNPSGLTCSALAAECDISHQAACNAIARMPDVYTDRWTPNPAGNDWARVLCLIPEDAPKPDVRVSEYLKTQRQRTATA